MNTKLKLLSQWSSLNEGQIKEKPLAGYWDALNKGEEMKENQKKKKGTSIVAS